MFPISVVLGLAVIIGLWKYILIAIAAICVLGVVLLVLYLYLSKQIESEKEVVLSAQDVREGLTARITVFYRSQTANVDFDIPTNARNQQKFVIKNILFENKKGKKVKKNLHFRVLIEDEEGAK